VADGDELVVGAGPGGGPRVIAFRSDGSVAADFFALPPDFTGGVNVQVVNGQIVTDGLADDVTQRNAALNATAGVPLLSAVTSVPVTAAVASPTAIAPATTTTPFLAGNPAPGSNPFLTVPGVGLLGPAAVPVPLPITTTATSGMTIGSALTAPGVFSATTTPIGTALTIPGVFSTTTTVPVGTTITGPGVFSTTATTPIGTAITGPGVFSTTTTTPIGTAGVGPGVFSTAGSVGLTGF
jgi:hypothetical protein